jgi:hypothetical protein
MPGFTMPDFGIGVASKMGVGTGGENRKDGNSSLPIVA